MLNIGRRLSVKKHTLLYGTLLLSISNILSRIIGAVYKIPLSRTLDPEIMGTYSYAFPIFIFCLSLCGAGVPAALGKLISEKIAKHRTVDGIKLFVLALLFFGTFSLVVSFILAFFAPFWSEVIIGEKNALYAIRALAPAVFFVTIMGVLRGYFQGVEYFLPYGLAEVIEQVIKALSAIYLGIMLSPLGTSLSAGGVAMGTTIGSGIAALFMAVALVVSSRTTLKTYLPRLFRGDSERSVTLLKSLLRISLPITVGTLFIPLMTAFDVSFFTRRMLLIPSMTSAEVTVQYAYLTTRAGILINFAPVVSMSVATSLLPSLSKCHAIHRYSYFLRLFERGLQTILIVAIPSAFGLIALHPFIFEVLFGDGGGSALLVPLSIGMIFVMINHLITQALHSIGAIKRPVVHMIIGAFLKSVFCFFMVPYMGIRALAIFLRCHLSCRFPWVLLLYYFKTCS